MAFPIRQAWLLCALTACGGPQLTAHGDSAPALLTAMADPPIPRSTSGPAVLANADEAPRSDAARRVLEAAARMYEEDEVVRGSCYRYVDTVFDEAGYDNWRRRSNVFRGSRSGPYADLDLVEPGDWLWIVNCADCDPIATHSVLFVSWADRAAGVANVYSYVGRSEERSADRVTYDVSRTYSIQRAIDPPPR